MGARTGLSAGDLESHDDRLMLWTSAATTATKRTWLITVAGEREDRAERTT